jgi:DNA-binding MarR family transcriptional regulator
VSIATTESISALERDLLGRLGYWKNTRTTYLASDLATILERPLSKTTAALSRLRARGLVRYFSSEGKGHAGKWEITHAGREIVALGEQRYEKTEENQ